MLERKILRDILLIEDNPAHVELIQDVLFESGVKNNIVVLKSGKEALNYIFCRGAFARDVGAVSACPLVERQSALSLRKKEFPCLILLDVCLPDMSGFEVLKQIKNARGYYYVPVVILTSSKNIIDVQTGYDLGANSYLVKPKKFEEFQQKISSAGTYWTNFNEFIRDRC